MRGLLITLVPLHCDLYLVVFALDIKGNHGGVNRSLGLVEVLNVINQAIWIVIGDLLLKLLRRRFRLGRRWSICAFLFKVINFIIKRSAVELLFTGFCICNGFEIQLFLGHALINKLDGQTLIKEWHLLSTTRNGVIVILSGFKDLWISPETDLGTSSASVATFFELFWDSVIKLLVPVLSLSLDFRFNARRQRVNDGDTNTV